MTVGSRAADRLLPLAAGAVVAMAMLAVAGAHPVGVFWDDGVYLLTAQAIADGEGYRFVHLPGSPPAVHFPPGWPLLLSVVLWITPDGPVTASVLRLVNPLLAALAAGLACAYGVRRLGLEAGVSATVTVVFALSLPVMVLGSVLFSEPTFLALAVVALAATDRAVSVGGVRAGAIAGALAGAAALVRSTGLVLVPATCLALVLAGRRREAVAALLAAAVLLVPWQAWSSAAAAELAPPLRGNYGPYLPWFAEAASERGPRFVLAIMKQNIIALQRSLAVVFFPVGLREVRPLLVALVAVGGGLGLVAAWRNARALALFVVSYALLVLAWPYAPDRFAWAVWPLAGLLLALGAREALRFAREASFPFTVRVSAALVAGVVALAMAGTAFYSARGASRGWVDVAQRRNAARLQPVVDWVASRTPADAVVATDGEPLVHLATGRRVVPVHVLSPDEYLAGTPLQQAADDLRALVAAGRADFVVLSAGSPEIEAAALLTSGVPHLVPFDTLPGGGVAFRVHWGPAAPTAGTNR